YVIDKEKELDILLKSNDSANETILRSSFDQMMNDYKRITQKGIEKFQELLDRGYTKEQATGVLGAVPLKDWGKAVDRLLAENIAGPMPSQVMDLDDGALRDAREANAAKRR